VGHSLAIGHSLEILGYGPVGHADKISISLYPPILSHGEKHLSNELT